MPSRRRLQQYAVAISIISVFYNAAEGVVSIVFGAESSSHSLIFYGIQSGVEVISALMVTWQFMSIVRPGDEDSADLSIIPKIIRIERIATSCIGSLLVALSLAAFGTSAASLAARDTPATALPSIIIAGSAAGIMIVLWLIKRYLAHALNSSTMNGEALCSLECTQLSVVLLIGSLIYHFWKGGWWVDSATTIVVGLLFGWEGVKMIKWARNKNFDGGCCEGCHSREPMGDEAALRTETPPDEKREEPSSSCSLSGGCCGGSKKELGKENCCSRKTKGDDTGMKCEEKKVALQSPCSASKGCCGNSKEPVKTGCCSKEESPQSSCAPLGGCCGSSLLTSRKQSGDETTPITATLSPDEKKDVSQSSCDASSGCCGASKKGRA